MSNGRVLKNAWKEFALKMVTSFVLRAGLLLIPILFGFTVDAISKGDYNNAFNLAIGLLITHVVYRLAEIFNTYSWHRLYNKMYSVYTRLALNKTHNNSIFSLSRISLSEYINIMNQDVDVLCTFFCDLPIRIFRVVEFIIIFVYFFMISLYIGAAGVGVALVVFLILLKSSKPIEKANQKRAQALDKKTSSVHELLLCIKEVKTLNVFEPIKGRILRKTNDYTNDLLTQRVTEDSFRLGSVMLIEVFKILLLMYGIFLIHNGQMELGVILVIYNYYGQLVDNISEFSVLNVRFRTLRVSTNRYNRILEYSRDSTETEEKLNTDPKGEIIFKDILYGYKEDPTLQGVSFDVKANTITAITGPSGSGRNGIFDLLLRLNRQHEGDIKIDDIDINDYSADEYFYLVSSVFKEPIFFNMSIKSNLSIVEEDFEKIVKVCKKLDIHDYIVNLKDGYETTIDNNAENIDESVKYLLGIARVFLKGSKVMLFDETFSTFDLPTKDKIIKLLVELKETHTIVIITRDAEVLKQADKVLVIDNSKLAVIGTHNKLLKNKLYKNNIVSG